MFAFINLDKLDHPVLSQTFRDVPELSRGRSGVHNIHPVDWTWSAQKMCLICWSVQEGHHSWAELQLAVSHHLRTNHLT